MTSSGTTPIAANTSPLITLAGDPRPRRRRQRAQVGIPRASRSSAAPMPKLNRYPHITANTASCAIARCADASGDALCAKGRRRTPASPRGTRRSTAPRSGCAGSRRQVAACARARARLLTGSCLGGRSAKPHFRTESRPESGFADAWPRSSGHLPNGAVSDRNASSSVAAGTCRSSNRAARNERADDGSESAVVQDVPVARPLDVAGTPVSAGSPGRGAQLDPGRRDEPADGVDIGVGDDAPAGRCTTTRSASCWTSSR